MNQMNGLESIEVANVWNNQGCCLFCIGRHSEARLKFEKALGVANAAIGNRAPRSAVIMKNLELSKKASGVIVRKSNVIENIALRPDSNRLIIGEFRVAALAPQDGKKKMKKKSKKR
jgi:hypothetical protein